ncbi:hypothetical protein mflW37_3810 [Mesoplasma florum W37]|uniref:Uncharacterized protein n=1 Tax=Mesoplasma florum TaxID=2151 RepID=A0AAD0HS60_MESFO|nr:hypothetical protein [Mesoplasma florum]AGY41448.1 hypothetical protein mflW37_3810 [Mesoplasma florum W37]AVN59666.1 hypothetical protein CG008_01985 [Mesoplasma florum]AVN65096.1 hypothetical protein CG002_01810 [Mesoplasma florum]AVN65788.1 hypothetical protein MflW12_3830 [Mesoplasma florum]
MIQIFKLKELNQVELSHLEELNSWWDKPVDKKIAKCKLFISKFGLQPNDYITFDSLKEVNFNDYIRGVNNYLNFYTPKLKTIVSERHAFKKFDKSIINYMQLNGYTASISTIASFYTEEVDHDLNKFNKIDAINFANKVLLEKWTKFKREVLSTFGGNEIIKDVIKGIFENEVIYDGVFFDSRIIVNTIVKYASNLLKKTEITEKQFLNIMYLAYLQSNFIESFIYIYKGFTINLK